MSSAKRSQISREDSSQQSQVVAIDGPSGSGKSTVARILAERLGFGYLDTGAMYRAVTWHLLENQFTQLEDQIALGALLAELCLEFRPEGQVYLNGENVTNHLRSREVESRVSAVSAVSVVRSEMRTMQRALARSGSIVAEGRDMASVVFPKARWKFFIDAEPEERARRRCKDFAARGRKVSAAEVLEEIAVRDRLDSTRKDAPLGRASDAIYLDTSGLDVEEVVATMLRIIEEGPGSGERSSPNSEGVRS